MAGRPYRALRLVLRIFGLMTGAGGLLIIFSPKPLVERLFLRPPASEVTGLMLFTLKELGGLAIMLSVLLFFASRDPERNVAIIDGVIVGLCVLTITPIVSLYTVNAGNIYPAYLIWGRSLVRLALAGLLFKLRPRGEIRARS